MNGDTAVESDPAAEDNAPTMGQWAHDVAAQYRALITPEKWKPRRNALEAEAAKYDAIGRRMDRITPVIPPIERRQP